MFSSAVEWARVRVTTDNQSVRLGFDSLHDSWPDFDCSQDSHGFVSPGASSLSRVLFCLITGHSPCLCQAICTHEVISKSFRTDRLERELQMVQLSATKCSCIAVLWVSLVSFAAISLCIVSQRVFIVVRIYFFIDSVRKLLDTLSYALFVFFCYYF
jgi:hypothetical protein